MIEKWNYILRIHYHSINILHLVNSLVLFWNRWIWNCSKSSSQPTKNSFFKFTPWRMPVYQVVLKCWWRMVQGINVLLHRSDVTHSRTIVLSNTDMLSRSTEVFSIWSRLHLRCCSWAWLGFDEVWCHPRCGNLFLLPRPAMSSETMLPRRLLSGFEWIRFVPCLVAVNTAERKDTSVL